MFIDSDLTLGRPFFFLIGSLALGLQPLAGTWPANVLAPPSSEAHDPTRPRWHAYASHASGAYAPAVALLVRLVEPERAVVDQHLVMHGTEVIGNWRECMYPCISRKVMKLPMETPAITRR